MYRLTSRVMPAKERIQQTHGERRVHASQEMGERECARDER